MIRRYFGLPGCGKTTFAVKLAVSRARLITLGLDKKHKFVFTNFNVNHPYVFKIDNDMIGKYNFENCLLIIDEATLFADNRDYKSFDKSKRDFFMLHRHYNCDIYLFHQEAGGVDKKIRSITDGCYYIKKCKLRPWRTKVIKLQYKVAIPESKGLVDGEGHELTEDVVMGYCMPSKISQMLSLSFDRRRLYKYFDSYERPELDPIPDEVFSKSITSWKLPAPRKKRRT